MDAITAVHDGQVQMIDTSIIQVYQHVATAKGARSPFGSLPRWPHHEDSRARRWPGRVIKLQLTAGQKSDIETALN